MGIEQAEDLWGYHNAYGRDSNVGTDIGNHMQDFNSFLKVRAMCSLTKTVFNHRAKLFGLSPDCHMPNLCGRVYKSVFFGFSGKLTKEDLSKVEACVPGAVVYGEQDQKVMKPEQVRSPGNVEFEPTVKAFDNGVNKYYKPQRPLDLHQVMSVPNITLPEEKFQQVDRSLWSLDRVDQRKLGLNGKYNFGAPGDSGTGKGVTVYVLDSGVMMTHQEFTVDGPGTGRRVTSGYDFVENDDYAGDCDGHGSHTAGTAVGLTVGFAKDAHAVSVRILDCNGSGTVSNTVAALDWVAQHAQKPAVVLLSLGIQAGSWSRILEDSTRTLIQKYGITVVAASGNSQVDACYIAPANVPEVITVAASDVQNKFNKNGQETDIIYYWSNLGPCVNLFAPGVDIYSVCGSSKRCPVLANDSYALDTGTSMAAPAVAGVAAIYLEKHPDATPAQVMDAIMSAATSGAIDEKFFMSGTPNKLLYSIPEQQSVQKFSGPPNAN